MKIFIGADHAGFELKGQLTSFLQELGHEVEDMGAYEYDPDDDYPDYISKVAQKVSGNPLNSRGIVIGGSGQGEAIIANKFRHVRCTTFYGQYEPKDDRMVPDVVKVSRDHNDTNMLSLGARFLTEHDAKTAVRKWIEMPYGGEERHKRRIEKIESLESEVCSIE